MKKYILIAFIIFFGFINLGFASDGIEKWEDGSQGLLLNNMNLINGFEKDSKGNIYITHKWKGISKWEGNSWKHFLKRPNRYGLSNSVIIKGSNGNDYLFNKFHYINLDKIQEGWKIIPQIPNGITSKYTKGDLRKIKSFKRINLMQKGKGEGRLLIKGRLKERVTLFSFDPVKKEWKDLNFSFGKLDGKPHTTLVEIDGIIFYKSNYSGLFALQNGVWNKITHNRTVSKEKIKRENGKMGFGWNGDKNDREIYYSYTPESGSQLTSDRQLKLKGNKFDKNTKGKWFLVQNVSDSKKDRYVFNSDVWKEYSKSQGYGYNCRPIKDFAYCIDGRFGGYFKKDNGIEKMPSYKDGLKKIVDPENIVSNRSWEKFISVRDTISNGEDIFIIVGIKSSGKKTFTIRKLEYKTGNNANKKEENNNNKIIPKHKKESQTNQTNLHSEYASFLDLTNIQSGGELKGNIVIGGQKQNKYILAVYNSSYNKVKEIETNGDIIHIDSNGNNIAVLTTTGISLYSKSLENIWNTKIDGLKINDYSSDKKSKNRISIGDDSTVALLKNKNIIVYKDGKSIYENQFKKTYATDIAYDSQRKNIYVSGYQQFNNLQVASVNAYKIGQNNTIWSTWNFNRNELSKSKNMADTRAYRIELSPDNKYIYVAGESAGGNTIYRYNGKDTKTKTLSGGDKYNASWGIRGAAHLGYIGKINVDNGVVEKGTIIVPRLISNGNGNSFRSKKGEIFVGENSVILAANGSCCGPQRNEQKINNILLKPYRGGEITIYATDKDLSRRKIWTSLADKNTGSGKSSIGSSRAIIKSNKGFELIGNVSDGNLYTTGNAKIKNNSKEKQGYWINLNID